MHTGKLSCRLLLAWLGWSGKHREPSSWPAARYTLERLARQIRRNSALATRRQFLDELGYTVIVMHGQTVAPLPRIKLMNSCAHEVAPKLACCGSAAVPGRLRSKHDETLI
jgi:hypothetical protein